METAFNKRLVTGAVVNIDYIQPQEFLKDAEETVITNVKKYIEKYNNIKVNTVFNGEFKTRDKEAVKSCNTENYGLSAISYLHEWYVERVVTSILTQLSEFQEQDSGWA